VDGELLSAAWVDRSRRTQQLICRLGDSRVRYPAVGDRCYYTAIPTPIRGRSCYWRGRFRVNVDEGPIVLEYEPVPEEHILQL